MYIDEDGTILKFFFKWIFKLIYLFAIVAVWPLFISMYIKQPEDRPVMNIIALIFGISMAIGIVNHSKDEKSSFLDMFKDNQITFCVFTSLFMILYIAYEVVINKEPLIDLETKNIGLYILGDIAAFGLFVFLFSWGASLISTCLTIFTQAVLKAFKVYKEVKEVCTDTGVKAFVKIVGSILSKGYKAAKVDLKNQAGGGGGGDRF